MPVRSSICSWKPPPWPSPGTGGAPKTGAWQPSTSWLYLMLSFWMIAAACVSRVVRFSNSSRMMKIVPQLDACALEERGEAGDGHGLHDAGRLQGDVVELLHDLSGAAADRGGFRQIDVDEQVTLVLFGNEAGRRGGETIPGQADQAGGNTRRGRQGRDASPGPPRSV